MEPVPSLHTPSESVLPSNHSSEIGSWEVESEEEEYPNSPTVSDVISEHCGRGGQEGIQGSPTTSDIISDHHDEGGVASTPRRGTSHKLRDDPTTPIEKAPEPAPLGRTRAQTRAMRQAQGSHEGTLQQAGSHTGTRPFLEEQQDSTSSESSEEFFSDEVSEMRGLTGLIDGTLHIPTLSLLDDTDTITNFNVTIEDPRNYHTLVHIPLKDHRNIHPYGGYDGSEGREE